MTISSSDDEQKTGLSRRALLSVSMALPLLLSTKTVFAQSAAATGAPVTEEQFHELAVTVIGEKAGDRTLSDAYYAAFKAVEPDFLIRAGALSRAVAAAGISAPAAFSASAIAKDDVARATALALTSAWYVGHVGNEKGPQRVVAYERALMWAPTNDVMVIPSYARGGPDYWAEQIPQLSKRASSL
jgi:fructose 5-dehydrogenase small subunit